MSRVSTRRSGSARWPVESSVSVKNWSPCSAMPALTKTESMRVKWAWAVAKAERCEVQEVMSQGRKSVWDLGWGKVEGGGWRSKRMRLWEGLSWERRVAVARPMPEEPPVMRMVWGWVERVVREEMEG